MKYVDCAHGSDDHYSCFGCMYQVSIGPWPEPVMKPLTKFRYSLRFIEQELDLKYGDVNS